MRGSRGGEGWDVRGSRGREGLGVRGSRTVEEGIDPTVPLTVNEKTSKVASEAVANARWIMRCTKPCPNCK